MAQPLMESLTFPSQFLHCTQLPDGEESIAGLTEVNSLCLLNWNYLKCFSGITF